MAGIDDWLSVARADDPDDVRERILTGYRDGKPFTPYVPTLAMPASVTTVLDFGCGLGRNFPYLTSIAREVVGFDLPPMIERCRTVGTHPVACLTSDWPEVLTRRFDLIVATLVLQLVADTGLFDAGECVEVEHDPGTNQLRVLGREAFDTLRAAEDGGHYEVLLRSRVVE